VAEGLPMKSYLTVVSTFTNPHWPTLKPKACKRAYAFSAHVAKGILAITQKQNKFVLRGLVCADRLIIMMV